MVRLVVIVVVVVVLVVVVSWFGPFTATGTLILQWSRTPLLARNTEPVKLAHHKPRCQTLKLKKSVPSEK